MIGLVILAVYVLGFVVASLLSYPFWLDTDCPDMEDKLMASMMALVTGICWPLALPLLAVIKGNEWLDGKR